MVKKILFIIFIFCEIGYLIATKKSYLYIDEMIVIVSLTLMLTLVVKKYKLITAFILYFFFALFDLITDYYILALTSKEVDGVRPPLSEVIPESFDDYSLLNIFIPLAIGFIAITISKIERVSGDGSLSRN